MSTSADRAAAVRALLRTERGAFASRLLGRAAPGVRARVLEVLRWQRRIDETLAGQLDRPLDRLDPEVRAVLRLGLAEAETMGVPPAVAVDGAVHLVRRLGKGSAAGLVNAVLRRAVRSWDALDRDGGPPDLVLSHPAWLWRRWLARFGLEAVASMRADQTPAPVWAWWLDEDALEELKGQNAWVKPHPWCPGAWTAPGPVLPREAAAGRAYIQDPASQLAAHLAASFAGGERATLAALCAAPGGKVALAARHARWARLVAGDLHPGRARHLAFLLGRVTDAPVAVWDAARPP
ncbi:MAG TPA: hypothetical protein ENK19_01015, partial [Acidobacteria bacterium]|nr:hypothetical protein [Acidobacteriota bacterium]